MRAAVLVLLVPSLVHAEPSPRPSHVEVEVQGGAELLQLSLDTTSQSATQVTLGVQVSYVTASGLAPTIGASVGTGSATCAADGSCLSAMVDRSERATVGLRYFTRPGFYVHAQALWTRTRDDGWPDSEMRGLGGLGGVGWRHRPGDGSFISFELDGLGWSSDSARGGEYAAIGVRTALTLGLDL